MQFAESPQAWLMKRPMLPVDRASTMYSGSMLPDSLYSIAYVWLPKPSVASRAARRASEMTSRNDGPRWDVFSSIEHLALLGTLPDLDCGEVVKGNRAVGTLIVAAGIRRADNAAIVRTPCRIAPLSHWGLRPPVPAVTPVREGQWRWWVIVEYVMRELEARLNPVQEQASRAKAAPVVEAGRQRRF